VTDAPTPEEIYAKTKKEGERRLSRPPLELAATAFVAGIDVVFGVVALGVVDHHLGHVAASVAFGVAFVFIVVGRSELFTENFLVPIAGLDHRDRGSWLKLGELWTLSPVFNIVGGFLVILVATAHGVLPDGTGESIVKVTQHLDENSFWSAFGSAVIAGALITLMTWMVEGAADMTTRIVTAWICGALLALGTFNHVIVVTLEGFMGIRYGAPYGWGDLAGNFGTALVGNMLGGILLVTLTRMAQARGTLSGE
jgi:formate/nitrite transporter FocA (FNT family)